MKLPTLLGHSPPVEATEIKLEVVDDPKLFQAAAMGDPATVRQLLTQRANVNAKESSFKKALRRAWKAIKEAILKAVKGS